MNFMNKMEKKFGKYAIPNLSMYLIAGFVLGYVLQLIPFGDENLSQLFTFNPYYIFQGQIWRLFTWVITPPEDLGIFTIIMLIFYYSIGLSMERAWGTFAYNYYIFMGLAWTILGSLLAYSLMVLTPVGDVFNQEAFYCGLYVSSITSTYYICTSIFLAFAATFPEHEVLLYMIIPIKVKWLGYLYAVMLVFPVISMFVKHGRFGLPYAIIILSSMANFLIFYLTTRSRFRGGKAQKAQRKNFKKQMARMGNQYDGAGVIHKCHICGRTNVTNPELTFRYCSKCNGNYEYCSEHLFTHEHIK